MIPSSFADTNIINLDKYKTDDTVVFDDSSAKDMQLLKLDTSKILETVTPTIKNNPYINDSDYVPNDNG